MFKTTSDKPAKKSKRVIDSTDPLTKKIKLKELIRRREIVRDERLAQYIPLEVQHIETVEQEISQQAELVEIQQNVQLHEIQEYGGQLIGFQEFTAPIYKNKVKKCVGSDTLTDELYALLKQELFANLPHAIKFVSPDAAEQLALNLPGLVSLNKDNLPNGFILKQTQLGELVLDYDAYLENEQSNPFTPVEFITQDQPVNKTGLKKQVGKTWINDTCLERISHYDVQKRTCLEKFLQNTSSSNHDLTKTVAAFEVFWNEVTYLCNEQKISVAGINNTNWSTPKGGNPVVYMERMLFILKNARSLSDQFILLKDISLDNYGAYYASRFEGFKTVSAEMALVYDAEQQNKQSFNKNFKQYRVELDSLSEDYAQSQKYFDLIRFASYYKGKEALNSPIWLVNCANELPQPLNLEQLIADGLAIPFVKDQDFVPPYQFYLRKTDGSMTLLYAERPKVMTTKEFYASCFRFIGLQTSGITVGSLSEQFREFKEKFWDDTDLSGELLAALFFISHERFIEDQPLLPIFNSLNHACIHKVVITNAINLLTKLYKLDIKLNQAEGLMLFESISGMNSAEFEGLRISKEECIKKLLTQLEQNKFAAFKFFDFRTKKSSPKWPFLYALDTAEYLAKDPMIAAAYSDDLLLFSGLINSIYKEVYYHARFADEQMKKPPAANLILGNLEQVKHYLHQAATKGTPNNLQYAIKVIINAKNYFTYEDFLGLCAEIKELPSFDSSKVDELLRKHKFTPSAELPEIFTRDNADLKGIMISLILLLEETKNKKHEELTKQSTAKLSVVDEDVEAISSSKYAELASLSIAELQVKLQTSWKESGTLLSIVGKVFLGKILKTTKDLAIKSAFGMPDAEGLLKYIAEKIDNLSDFQDDGDFEKVNKISNEAAQIAYLFRQILKNPYVVEHEQEFLAVFTQVDFSKIDYETLYGVLFLLTTMPQRNYLSLLNTFFADSRFIGKKERVVELLNLLSTLNNSYFPSEYLDAFSKLVIANPGEKGFRMILAQMVAVYEKDNKDFILELIMFHPELTYKQVFHMLNLTDGIEHNRDKISDFLIHLIQINKLESFLIQIVDCKSDAQKKILEILSKAHVLNRVGGSNRKSDQYNELVALLTALSAQELDLLYSFYQATPMSTECLLNALKRPGRTKDFQSFLFEFEKAPFGERDLIQQFSCREVERVINKSKDLINNSVYTYQYRKQLMEAFLLVNEIGEHLPVYYNKPAKELTNAEIKSYFADLKAKKIAGLSPFQNRLLALGLMREAMYRSTGEFSYSTQVIALIDGMMHQGDFISNIDTGQGKSLIDSMKAALLWLDSDRVDLTTSSLIDAKRDIANYGPFLKLLGIPYSETPISSASSKEVFQKNGVNFSTFAQLSLFFAKARVTGEELDNPDTVVSLVANESDYTILDDRVIYRFATTDSSAINYGQEWIYYGINEFVTRQEFIENDRTTAKDDIADLKAYLKIKARELKKSEKIVNKFSDTHYLSLLESALTVNYILKENEDYVIPDEFEKKVINGAELRSKVIKVLMKDKKVSQDSTFGNGIQQFLYAFLNRKRESTDFVIEPQNKTIISTNNINLLEYYRAKKGFIWGSSGTVGSRAEIDEQYKKYGIEFSGAEPHQKNQVKYNEPIIKDDEEAQFNELIRLLTKETWGDNRAPSIVFCKDINTANRFYKELEKQNSKKIPMQLYTGLGKEEDYIQNAGKTGMITVTTSALGRNTDIHYDKIKGLRVWHTFIDSTRGSGQKSGRTGRQGSPGEVNYVLNALELGNKTIEEIRAEIDQFALLERSVNEELYSVLGYLLVQIDIIPNEQFIKGKTAFLRDIWAQFSAATEAEFREGRLDIAFDKEHFIQKTLIAFNQIMAAALTKPVVELTTEAFKTAIEKKYPQKSKYTPYPEEVKLADCTPPIAIAYHLLQVATEEKSPETTREAIKAKLSQVFERISKTTFAAENRDYLHYLAAKPSTQKVIVEAHKEFLTQYLQDHSKKLNIVQRWLGFEGKLSQIASNEHYLLMFHAFASVPNKPIVELEVIKQAVNTLLDEYLDTSWFISAERKKWALELKDIVSKAGDIDELICCLSKTQVEVAKQDIAANKGRSLKPLHLFGHSRYQNVLSNAINLAASLSAKTDVDELTCGLTPLISEVTDKTPVSELTLDELKHRAKSQKCDKGNASVINQTLENALKIKNRKTPVGMLGRKGIFSSPQVETIIDKDTDSIPNTHPNK